MECDHQRDEVSEVECSASLRKESVGAFAVAFVAVEGLERP